MKMFVDALSLNLRSQPIVSPSTKIGSLFLGTAVEVAGSPDAGGFVKVTATIDGAKEEGFVSAKFLREPASDTREALIAEAVKQWLRFERGLGKEHVRPFFRFVGEMWQALNPPLALDGRDRDVPWSAACISFIARKSGPAYAKFKFAPGHSKYIHDSINKRSKNNKDTPFWGFRLHERRPKLGDMVCRWREQPIDFDTAEHSDSFKSHCDIVVSIDSANNTLLAIGGNVSHSVSVTSYHLTAGDFLADRDAVFALLANITDDT